MKVEGDGGTPDRSRRPPVMSDVGRLAGVSHQTVSRVINGSSHVRPATRQRVLRAMQELGYRPNSIARALVTGRSQTVGVVSFDTTLYGPASTLFGIERAAHEAGYFVIIASLKALDRASVTEAVNRLSLQGVDGIVVIVSEQASAEDLLSAPAAVPLVAVEGRPGQGIPVVAVDQCEGAGVATRHLLALGHRTVWHITGPVDSVESRERIRGWELALRDAGAPVPDPLTGDWSPRSGYFLGQRLSRMPEVTAVFVAGDQMALGVLRAMHESGRQVPEEVSVVGFDDIPEAEFFTPPLTTVCQDFGEVGSRGLRLLMRAMEAHTSGGQPPSGSLIAPELKARASTAAPAS